MVEVMFAMWLGVCGVLLLTPVARTVAPAGALFISPIVATAMYILAGLVLVAGSGYSVALAVGLVTAASLAALAAASRMGSVSIRWLSTSVVGVLVLSAVVAAVSWRVPMVRLTTDSFHHLMSAGSLVQFGTLTGILDSLLLKRQLAVPLLHTFGVETGRGYVAFWAPLLGVSAFGTLAWLAAEALRSLGVSPKIRWVIIAPTIAFALSTNRVGYHFFYVNGHMLFAALLLGAVGMGWLAVGRKAWILLVPASLLLAALIPLRAESMIVVAVFLVPFVTARAIPVRWRIALIVPTLAAVALWDLWVLPGALADTSFDSLASPLSEAGVAVVVLGILTASVFDRSGFLERWAPGGMLAAIGITLGAFVAIDSGIFTASVAGLASNLFATGGWGVFWALTLPLFLVAAAIGFDRDRFIVPGVFGFALALPVLAYLRGSPFGDHIGDSANRMVLHIAPLVLLTIMMAGASVAAEQRSGPGTGITGDREALVESLETDV